MVDRIQNDEKILPKENFCNNADIVALKLGINFNVKMFVETKETLYESSNKRIFSLVMDRKVKMISNYVLKLYFCIARI